MPTATDTGATRAPLPGWGDLRGARRGADAAPPGALARLSSLRFVLIVLTVASAAALYVGHVHATQALLSDVERARAERQRLQFKANRLQSAFDEATAPAVIHRRARALGLRQGLPATGATIYMSNAPKREDAP